MNDEVIEPTAAYLRRGAVKAWLEPIGIKIRDFDAMVRAGVIGVKRLKPNGRGYYLREEIKVKILNAGADARTGREG